MRRVNGRRLLGVLAAVAAIVLIRLALSGPEAPKTTAPPTIKASGQLTPPVSPSATTPGPPVLAPLPITATDLDHAARTAAAFVTAFGTYRYDETPDAYLARLTGLADPALVTALASEVRAPALQAQRQRDKTIAIADATVTATSDITPISVTFIVTGHQHLTSGATARSSDTQTFTVQITLQHGTWLVHAAGIHNGDPPS